MGFLEEVDPELSIGDGSPSWDWEEGIWIEEKLRKKVQQRREQEEILKQVKMGDQGQGRQDRSQY